MDFGVKKIQKTLFIMSFNQIGWCDPFVYDEVISKNSWQEPVEYDDLVCNPKLLVKDRTPRMLSIPSKELMFKMMRACIGIEAEEELWFYK